MIKTGITTDEKFREAVNANGANVKSSSVPKTLKDALSTFGKEVSYNITNENVLKTVNSRGGSSDTLIMRTNNNLGDTNNLSVLGADEEYIELNNNYNV